MNKLKILQLANEHLSLLLSSIHAEPSDLVPILERIAEAAGRLEQNALHYAYTIRGKDGSPYLTRVLFPRGGDFRLMLHKIHRPDQDRHLHNHPWWNSRSTVLTGGYKEERTDDPLQGPVPRIRHPGHSFTIGANVFHRITYVMPNTWTLFQAGRHTEKADWGFLVDGKVVSHTEYLK